LPAAVLSQPPSFAGVCRRGATTVIVTGNTGFVPPTVPVLRTYRLVGLNAMHSDWLFVVCWVNAPPVMSVQLLFDRAHKANK
jgi:hypothetical protein